MKTLTYFSQPSGRHPTPGNSEYETGVLTT